MTADNQVCQRQFTDADYIDSIEDPFFKSVAQHVATVSTDGDIDKAASANIRLEELEISLRKKLLELLLSLQNSGDENSNSSNASTKGGDSTAAADVIGVFWKSSLDLCHHIVHHALSSSPSESNSYSYENLMPCRRFPYLLLSDCIEGLPSLEDAKCFWSVYVEPELVDSVLFGDKFWSQLTETNNSKKLSLPSSHLPFLKVANQFLKRLEHASDNGIRVEWKGRIMWALSKGFSITDKSSLKAWGNFHASNGTDFESKEEFNKYTDVPLNASTNTMEYSLYEAFWSVQNDFSNPNKINVGDFIKRLRLILAAMESAVATNTSAIISEDGDGNGGTDKQTTKYLTSSALLPSQIQDPTFRSSVAAQFLIVASHLGAESPPLKNALASLLGRARKLLKNDNPQLHVILWESILVNGREDHWRTWKKQKCVASAFAPNFKRKQQLDLDSVDAAGDDRDRSDNQQKRRRLDKEDKNGGIQEEVVSSSYSNFLKNSDLNAVHKDLHHKLPTLEEHMEPYVEALDPESGIEDEYHPKNDSLFTWRAMRLYAKHQLPLMSQCRKPADLEKITREWYRQCHGKDIPGEMPATNEMDITDDIKKKDGVDSTDFPVSNDRDDDNKNDSGNMDTEMKDVEVEEQAQKNVEIEKDDEDVVHSKDTEGDKVKSELENTQKSDEAKPNADNVDTAKHESNETESKDVKKENSGPTKSESGAVDKSKTVADEPRPKSKTVEAPKSNTAIGTTSERKNNDDNKNDKQKQDKRPPRENVPPQNRGGGRRGNDGGRNIQERGRRDDGPPPRRRGDDNHQSRGGGRSGGDSSYRGRSDGPPPRGGRYDEDYRGDSNRHHGDNRGDRFGGERPNRSTGRDNHRGGDRGGGGIGRDDHRGGRSRVGGGGGGRRRR